MLQWRGSKALTVAQLFLLFYFISSKEDSSYTNKSINRPRKHETIKRVDVNVSQSQNDTTAIKIARVLSYMLRPRPVPSTPIAPARKNRWNNLRGCNKHLHASKRSTSRVQHRAKNMLLLHAYAEAFAHVGKDIQCQAATCTPFTVQVHRTS